METGGSKRSSKGSHRARDPSNRYRRRRRDRTIDHKSDDNGDRDGGPMMAGGGNPKNEGRHDEWEDDRMRWRKSGRDRNHRNRTNMHNDDNANNNKNSDNVDNNHNSSSGMEENDRRRRKRRRRTGERSSRESSQDRTRRSESPSTCRFSGYFHRKEDEDDHHSQRSTTSNRRNRHRRSHHDRDESTSTRRKSKTPKKGERNRRERHRSRSSQPSTPSPHRYHHRSRSSRYEDASPPPVETMRSSRRQRRSPRYERNQDDLDAYGRYYRRQHGVNDREYNDMNGRDYRRRHRPLSPDNSAGDSSSYRRRRRGRHPLRRSVDSSEHDRRRRRRNIRDSRRRRHHRRRDGSSSPPSDDDLDILSSSSSSESSANNAAAPPIRAGVVSDDEHQQHQHHQYPPYEEAAAQHDSTTASHRPPPLSNTSKTKLKDKTGSDASSSRDDTVGHYQGPIGSVIANRYRITADVGLGTFGRVVECLDLKKRRSQSRRRGSRWSGGGDGESSLQPVAIKIVRNVKRYYDSALIEADILEDVNRRGGRGISHCVMLFDAFAYGGHFCLVFESLGPSLYDFLKRHSYQPFPMMCVRRIARQLLEALEFLHSFGLIHTDLKPENILLTSYREQTIKFHGRTYQIPESTHIKVIDFGGATYNDERKSSVVNTRQYRAPEVILGVGWSTPSDLWSAGCILAELCRGELLFATHDNLEHLALMERCIGQFSRRMLKRAKQQGQPPTEFSTLANQAFDSSGRHRMERVLSAESYAYVQRMLPLDVMMREQVQQQQQADDRVFIDMLRRMLVIDPDERKPAGELLREYRL